MSTEMELGTTLGLVIMLFTIGVFLWRVIVYFYNKTKCFNNTIATNKQLVTSMETMEKQINEIEHSFDELKKEIKDDFNLERTAGTEVHKEIFARINNIDKNLAYIAGQKSQSKVEVNVDKSTTNTAEE